MAILEKELSELLDKGTIKSTDTFWISSYSRAYSLKRAKRNLKPTEVKIVLRTEEVFSEESLMYEKVLVPRFCRVKASKKNENFEGCKAFYTHEEALENYNRECDKAIEALMQDIAFIYNEVRKIKNEKI